METEEGLSLPPQPALFNSKGLHSRSHTLPFRKQGLSFLVSRRGETVVFSRRAFGTPTLITLAESVLAELPQQGIDGAFLCIRENLVEPGENFIAVFVPLGEQVQKTQLNQILL